MATLKNTTLLNTDTLTIPSGTTAQRPTAIYSTPGTYSWTAPAGVTSVDVLVVAGGGGGGGNLGGGGGAGGVVYQLAKAVTPGSSYTVTVGAGGQNTASGTQNGVRGINGGNSVFDNITANGGGGAGAGTTNTTGNGGGSGGGGSGYGSASGGSATQGSNGDARYGSAGGSGGGGSPAYGGGGGGGAGGAGSTAPSNNAGGGAGGAGVNISAFGRWFWAGGGGGGCYVTGNSGAGGSGGGGGGGSGGGANPAGWGDGTGYQTRPSSATVVALGGNTENSSTFTRGIGLGYSGGFNQYYIGEPATATSPAQQYVSGGHGGECTGSGGGGGTHQGWVGGNGGSGYVIIKWCNAGAMRYNTDYQVTEYFDGAIWRTIDKTQIAYSTGAEIYKIDNDIVHAWTSAGTHYFYPQYTGDLQLLVVGGGGSGGTSSSNCSAGGGGGGMVVETTHTVIGGNTYTITVGQPGLGGAPASDGVDNSFLGVSGTSSSFIGPNGVSPVYALFGGGGGAGQSRVNGKHGGSGGGGAHPNGNGGLGLQPGNPFMAAVDGTTTSTVTTTGGSANNSSPTWGGGGGGGALENGATGTSTGAQNQIACYGGGGRSTGILGEIKWFGGGGGGGSCSGSTYNSGTGGIGGGGSSWNLRAASHGVHNTGGGGGAGSYNGGGYNSGDGATGIVVVRYPAMEVTIGNSSSNPARSASQIKAYNPEARTGLYWITDGTSTQQIFCDMEHDGGGWMLVASNDARDTTIPAGTSRQSQSYELDRPNTSPGASGNALVGTVGIDPNGDYIVGGIINNLPFSQVRVWGWGFGSTNNTYRWPDNLGSWAKGIWGLTTTGSSRLLEVRPRRHVFVTGNTYGSNTQRNGYLGTLAISASAPWWILDAIKGDRNTGGYDANANQTTIGAAGVQSSVGNPTSGTYMGHGSGEGSGSYEGWYNGIDSASDCQGYTTWVR